jgi:arsenate reductase (glutaredoxin)
LSERGVDYESVNYIKHPLSVDELKELLQRAALTPHDVLRTKEPASRKLVAGKNLDNDQLLQVMAAHPELLQRPIVAREDKAVLARPVGNLAKLGIK